MSFTQFIGLIAALMATNALAIDSMLPALPVIAHSLGLSAANQQQWIVTAYLLGFGAAQILYGPLSDRFGRRAPLLVGLVIYACASVVAAQATTLEVLLFARVIQGLGSAATRVLAVSVVRDCYVGSRMAQVMSFSFIVFLAVPIIAPSVGQVVMLFGPWQSIFYGLAIFSSGVAIWLAVKLPETLHADDRLPIEVRRVLKAYRITLTDRLAVGYMLAMMMMLGGLFGFINSAQQIFAQVLGAPQLFTTVFALVASCMALSSLLNARIVQRVGTRRVSHVALCGFITCGVLHSLIAAAGYETLWTFAMLQAGTMFCFGLVASNFGSLAMGPLGHVAGTASSVQGFVTTFGGAAIGFLIGQSFDGTVLPLTIGFSCTGLAALAFVAFAENGRLFRTPQLIEPDAGRAS